MSNVISENEGQGESWRSAINRSRDFLETMRMRRSVRAFRDTMPDLELIMNAIRTAGSAPSGANSQPWHFAIVRDIEIKKRIRAQAEAAEREFYDVKAPESFIEDLRPLRTNSQKPYLTEAPYLIVVFSRSTSDHATASGGSYYARESTGIAVGLLLASLKTAGLATLTHTPSPMSFLNECFGFNRSYRPFMIVVVGEKSERAFIPNLTKKSLDEISSLF